MKIKIDSKWVGDGEPCFIIAEAGVNHNGNVEIAKRMIDKAAEIGADAIKFQTFLTEELVLPETPKARYQRKTTSSKETQFEMLKKLELNRKDHELLIKYAKKKKIIFLSTPYDKKSVDLLESLGVPAFKIASCDLTNLPLIRYVARKKKPIILSTGMSTIEEIMDAVRVIEEEGNEKIILLHAVSNYPCRVEELNLRCIITLRKTFGYIVGFSDHSLGIIAPLVAIALGAKVVEKHFTLDRNMAGPDHRASLEPKEFKEMIKKIRMFEKSLGDGIKKPTRSERENIKLLRRSVVSRVDIPKGARIKWSMLCVKRPGTGISSRYIDKIIGKRAKVFIKKGMLIEWKMLDDEQ